MSITAIIILTLALSAFFSGMEVAFISANKIKIELDRGKGMLAARILSFFYRDPSRMIGSLLLGNHIAMVIYGIAMAFLLEPWLMRWLPEYLQYDIFIILAQIVLATLVILFFAEFLPKTLFRLNANAVISFFAVPMLVIYYVLYPFVFIFLEISRFILGKLFRVDTGQEAGVFTPVDLDQFINELARDVEQIEDVQQEIQMVQNVIGFRKVKLRETMLPRNEIVAVEELDTVDALRSAFISRGLSRIPIYRDNIDNIIGYAHAFDMFRSPATISDIIKPIMLLPETMPAKVALTRFIRERKNIAIVVDEFGGTSGLVTMEDIMEEIFGEIEDEFDAAEKVEKVIRPGEYVFSARLEIDYLNDKYKLGLPTSADYETLAGLIIHFHESIPAMGESILITPYRFDILQAAETRIELVRVAGEES